MMDLTAIQKQIDFVSENMDADVIIYSGNIKWPYDDYLIDECRKKRSRRNVLLILTTSGGQPDAAYRIARCLQQAYRTVIEESSGRDAKIGNFIVYVSGVCKSAGTLICLAADKLIMSGNGELGPLDTQLREKHEVGERTSGLTPIHAVDFLTKRASTMFESFFNSLRFSGSKFSTKIATDVAAQMTTGLLAPLAGQIDPIRLAEVERSLSVSLLYGERLKTNNLQEGTLETLIHGYPSHEFVIDKSETRELFKCVEDPCDPLREIGKYCSQFVDEGEPSVTFASTPKWDALLNLETETLEVFAKSHLEPNLRF